MRRRNLCIIVLLLYTAGTLEADNGNGNGNGGGGNGGDPVVISLPCSNFSCRSGFTVCPHSSEGCICQSNNQCSGSYTPRIVKKANASKFHDTQQEHYVSRGGVLNRYKCCEVVHEATESASATQSCLLVIGDCPVTKGFKEVELWACGKDNTCNPDRQTYMVYCSG